MTQKKTPAVTGNPADLFAAWPITGRKELWGKDKPLGELPTAENLSDVIAAGCRAGSGQGLALALTLRSAGSTRAQRTMANTSGREPGTKPADNVGGLGEARRNAYGKGFNFDPSQTYNLTLGRLTVAAVFGPHGHVTAKRVSVAEPAAKPVKTPAKAEEKATKAA